MIRPALSYMKDTGAILFEPSRVKTTPFNQ